MAHKIKEDHRKNVEYILFFFFFLLFWKMFFLFSYFIKMQEQKHFLANGQQTSCIQLKFGAWSLARHSHSHIASAVIGWDRQRWAYHMNIVRCFAVVVFILAVVSSLLTRRLCFVFVFAHVVIIDSFTGQIYRTIDTSNSHSQRLPELFTHIKITQIHKKCYTFHAESQKIINKLCFSRFFSLLLVCVCVVLLITHTFSHKRSL